MARSSVPHLGDTLIVVFLPDGCMLAYQDRMFYELQEGLRQAVQPRAGEGHCLDFREVVLLIGYLGALKISDWYLKHQNSFFSLVLYAKSRFFSRLVSSETFFMAYRQLPFSRPRVDSCL